MTNNQNTITAISDDMFSDILCKCYVRDIQRKQTIDKRKNISLP
jgi:hypothetical protein